MRRTLLERKKRLKAIPTGPAWAGADSAKSTAGLSGLQGFRMVAKIEGGKVTLYSRNGQIISRYYIEVAQALEGVKGDAGD